MSGMRTVKVFSGLALAALFTVGCGARLPPKTDLAQARTALTAALDAWKEGRAIETLKDQNPPVDFRDVHWDRGVKLTKYLVEKEETSGLSARFSVKLFLAEKAGESRERVIAYNADTGPTIVIRPDF